MQTMYRRSLPFRDEESANVSKARSQNPSLGLNLQTAKGRYRSTTLEASPPGTENWDDRRYAKSAVELAMKANEVEEASMEALLRDLAVLPMIGEV